MKQFFQLTQNIATWLSVNSEEPDSQLLLQSLEERVLYSAVPLPVENVEPPMDQTELDDVVFAEIQSNTNFNFANDEAFANAEADDSSTGLLGTPWDSDSTDNDLSNAQPADATLDELEQLVDVIQQTDVVSTENSEPATAATLLSETPNSPSQNSFRLQEGQSFVINGDFLGGRSASYPDGFVLAREANSGVIYNNGQLVSSGDFVDRAAIDANDVIFVPAPSFVGVADFSIESDATALNFVQDDFALLYQGVADDGTVVLGTTFAPVDGSAPVFEAPEIGSETYVEALSDGSYVVVANLGDGLGDLQFQQFDRTGAAIGGAVTINETQFDVDHLAVTSIEDGGFLVAFEGQSSGLRQIFIQRYDQDGHPTDFDNGETQLTTPGNSNASDVSILSLGEGRFVVSYTRAGNSTIDSIIYNADGVVETQFVANASSSGTTNLAPQTTLLSNGGFVLTWTQQINGTGGTSSIEAAIFDPAGHIQRQNINLIDSTTPNAISVAATADNGFVVLWQSPLTESTEIYASRFDSLGAQVGDQALVGQGTAGVDASPDVITLGDGTFVISHTVIGENGTQEILGQRFNQDFVALGDAFTINSFSGGDQTGSQLALLNDGTLVATFTSSDSSTPETLFHQRLQMAAQGDEDSWIALDSVIEINADSATEVIERISLSGLPVGTKVTNGDTDSSGNFIFREILTADQNLTLNASDIEQLSIMPPADVSGVLNATITLTTNDQGDSNTTATNFQIVVDSIVDTPTPIDTSVNTNEDTVLSLTQAEFIANFVSPEGTAPNDLVNSISNVDFAESNFEANLRNLPSPTSGIGSAFIFDGSTPLTAQLPSINRSASFEFWIRPENLSGAERVIAQFGDADDGFSVLQRQDEVILRFQTNGSEIIELNADGLIGAQRTGSYDQIVVSFGTSLGDPTRLDAAIYLNGQLAESITDVATIQARDLLQSSSVLNLGQPGSAGGVGSASAGNFGGELGLFRFDTDFFDQSEVRQRFDATRNAPRITSINGTDIRPGARIEFTSQQNAIASSLTVATNGDLIFDLREDFNQLRSGSIETIELDVSVQSGSESFETQSTINVAGRNDIPVQQFDQVSFNRNGGVGIVSLNDLALENDGTATAPAIEPSNVFLATAPSGINIINVGGEFRLEVDPLQFPSQDSVTFQIGVNDPDSGEAVFYDLTVNFVDEFTISGVVAHDANLDGSIEGDDGFAQVEVELFQVLGNSDLSFSNIITAGRTTTDAQGRFVFDTGLSFDTTYFVVVNSRSVLLDPADAFSTWAQQTYASRNAIFNDGNGLRLSDEDGYLIGGRDSEISDRFADTGALADSQHVISVTSSGNLSEFNELGFGFNFDVVNVIDNGDQFGTSSDRLHGQGTLTQFIHNSNHIDGENRLVFLPTAAANASNASGDQWWQIQVEELLPEIRDDLTIIDGRAFEATADGLVRLDLNPGVVPGTFSGSRLGIAGDRIGESDIFLDSVDAPDLEITRREFDDAGNALPELEYGIKVRGDADNLDVQGVEIRNIAIHGFGTRGPSFSTNNLSANIVIDGGDVGSDIYNVSDFRLQGSVLGVRPDFTQFAAGHNLGNNISVISAEGALVQTDPLLELSRYSNTIENNIFANADLRGIYVTSGSPNQPSEDNSSVLRIANNQIISNGLIENRSGDGIELTANTSFVTIEGNYIGDNFSVGIDTFESWGNNSIIRNTIENNRSQSGTISTETGGVRLFGNNNEVFGNSIRDNAGSGVHVVGEFVGFFNVNIASFNNFIHSNEFANNDGIAIDNSRPLVPGGTRARLTDYDSTVFSNGDGVTSNDQAFDNTVGNFGVDAPEIESATYDGEFLTVRFSADLERLNDPDSIIQIYRTSNGTTHGQGETFLGEVILSDLVVENGLFVAQLSIPDDRLPLDPAQEISINATVSSLLTVFSSDVSGNATSFTGFNTSEFSASRRTTVNRPPTFSSRFTSIIAAEGTTTVSTPTATDLDGDNLTFSIIGGPDASNFTIDAITGDLSFITPPDFEAPNDANSNNLYQVILRVTDARGASDITGVSVRITNANEAPEFSGGSNFTVPEGSAVVLGQAFATDPEGDAIVYSIDPTVQDGALFTIDADGNIRFVSAPDFESPLSVSGGNDYVFTVTADGGNGQTTERQFTVNVTDVVEDPTLSVNPTVAVAEGNTLVQTVTAVASDGQPLSVEILAGGDSGLFTIDAAGNISFLNPPDFENPLDSGGNNVYEVTVVATDDSGNQATQTIIINVTPTDERPFYIGSTADLNLSQDESTSESFDLVPLFSDQENDDLSLQIVGGADAGLFEIVNNELALIAVPEIIGAQSPIYQVDIVASDGTNTSEIETLNLQINNVNDSPIIVSPQPLIPIEVVEGETGELFKFTGIDRDGDAISFSIDGRDASFFEISSDGQLNFTANAPVFDPNGANLLEVQVRASDPLGASASQTLQVAVMQAVNNSTPSPTAPPPTSPPPAAIVPVAAPIATDRPNIDDSESNSTITPPQQTPADAPPVPPVVAVETVAPLVPPSPITPSQPQLNESVSAPSVVPRTADINGLAAVADLEINDEEAFLDLTSDTVSYLSTTNDQGPQLVTQEIGDIIETQRSGISREIDESLLVRYFWEGFDDSEDEFIRENLMVDTTSIVAASAGLSLGLVSYLRAAAMATTVVTQLPAWKTLDVSPLISAFDKQEAETIHQIVDA